MSALESSAFDGAIRNPDDNAHLMVIKPVTLRVRIYFGDLLLADTRNAIRIMEIGRSFYDPVVYVPERDLKTVLAPVEKSTHCPIKGDASYVALNGEELGWIYENPLSMASQLTGYYAFWPSKTRLVQGE